MLLEKFTTKFQEALGFLELGGEFVETHGLYPPNCRALEALAVRFQDRTTAMGLICVSEAPPPCGTKSYYFYSY